MKFFHRRKREENPLSDIANFFKTQLMTSWQKFQSVEELKNEYTPVEEIIWLLDFVRQESALMWIELIRSIRTDNELLFDTGLTFRMTPAILVSLLHEIWLIEEVRKESKPFDSTKKQKVDRAADLFLTEDQCVLLRWCLSELDYRTATEKNYSLCCRQQRWEDVDTEISNIPHANWIPSEHVPWLILELEMNITIRKVQADVARHMIDPSGFNRRHQREKYRHANEYGRRKNISHCPYVSTQSLFINSQRSSYRCFKINADYELSIVEIEIRWSSQSTNFSVSLSS